MISTGPVLEARRAPTLVPQHAKAEERRRIVPATVLMLAAAIAVGVTVRALPITPEQVWRWMERVR